MNQKKRLEYVQCAACNDLTKIGNVYCRKCAENPFKVGDREAIPVDGFRDKPCYKYMKYIREIRHRKLLNHVAKMFKIKRRAK